MNVFMSECVDTYVRSCTPAPLVPAGDVVKTVTDTLAATGGTADQAGLWIAGFFAIGAILLFIYNDLRKRDRNNDE